MVQRCCTIRDRCQYYLAVEHYPSPRPTELARLLDRIAELFEGLLQKTVSLPNGTGCGLEFAVAINDALKRIAYDLQYVETATSKRVPWGIIESFESFCRESLGRTDFCILLCPRWDYNYGLANHDLHDYYSDLLEATGIPQDKRMAAIGSFPRNFYVASFPQLERTNVFLHAALGHEIGHVLAKEYLTSQKQSVYVQLAQDLLQWMDENPNFVQSLPPSPSTAEDLFTWVCSLRDGAINEIVADLYAVRCFGPAAFFSLHEMAQQYAMDESPLAAHYYPPWRLRLRCAARVFGVNYLFPLATIRIPGLGEREQSPVWGSALVLVPPCLGFVFCFSVPPPPGVG